MTSRPTKEIIMSKEKTPNVAEPEVENNMFISSDDASILMSALDVLNQKGATLNISAYYMSLHRRLYSLVKKQ